MWIEDEAEARQLKLPQPPTAPHTPANRNLIPDQWGSRQSSGNTRSSSGTSIFSASNHHSTETPASQVVAPPTSPAEDNPFASENRDFGPDSFPSPDASPTPYRVNDIGSRSDRNADLATNSHVVTLPTPPAENNPRASENSGFRPDSFPSPDASPTPHRVNDIGPRPGR